MDEIFATKHALMSNQLVMYPHKSLPKPEAPKGVHDDTASLENNNLFSSESVTKFFQERKNSFSKAISTLNDVVNIKKSSFGGDGVTEFNVPGVRVVVRAMADKRNDGFAPDVDENELGQLKGRVTFFSRSNCRDCGAVRKMLKEKGLKYAEINMDVYPTREKELIDRTGSSMVPQIYFNDKLIGGLVALNSLRNSGLMEQTAKQLLSSKCSDDAPNVPVYGFDDSEDNHSDDEINPIVKLLRQKLPIQDRLIRLRIVKNSFTALHLVHVLIFHLGCSRNQAVDIGKEIARKHFIHHVSGGTRFEDGDEIYRFLEHEQFIPKCYNFRGCTYDKKPDSALRISQQLMKIMSAILESYASEDRRHVDYLAISNSEEFRRYLNLVQGLQRVDLHTLSTDEKLAFFLNLYNAMVIHAVIRKGCPEGMLERKSFVSDFFYLVGGNPYSLNAIKNGILRCNRRAPYALVKPFNSGDDRLQMVLPAVNSLIHFGLCDGAKSSPRVRFFTSQNVQSELRAAAREFFRGDVVEVDLFKRTVYLTSIFKWYNADFGSEKEILKWIMNYLEANKAGLVTHLMNDGGIINVVYQNFDWSINS